MVDRRYKGSVSCMRGRVPPSLLCTTSWWNSSMEELPGSRLDPLPLPRTKCRVPLEVEGADAEEAEVAEDEEPGGGLSGMKAATSRASITISAPNTKGGPGTSRMLSGTRDPLAAMAGGGGALDGGVSLRST